MKPALLKKRMTPWLWAAPAVFLLLTLVAWPAAQMLRLSFNDGGGQSGFSIGGGAFYKPGTWTSEVWRALLTDRYFWEVLGFTVKLGAIVTGLCVPLGCAAAHFIWSLPQRWKPWAAAAVVVPKLSSLLITVYGLKIILGDYGPVNAWLTRLHVIEKPLALQHSLTGVVIGKTLLVLPYTILLIWAGLERVDHSLCAAARGLGAGPFTVFRRVTLPLSLPALGAAALLSLIWALGAFISPYLLGGPEEITLAVDVQRQMFENLHWPRGAAEGAALTLTLILVTSFRLIPRRTKQASSWREGAK